ncbi:AlpA family transcriptional regulator [Falsiroseomonas sp.]|uniref:helix-turn-helix transcriptional regulator n=1 Tax=Falsiroseomonas sp. TaxID=2870721 RepID=UPI0027209FA7|nr:hypothetical protein [Falsiroseomonas sp.]MDO9501998.1 hypothetical protein [Falsiroseomonas sp.]
MSDRYLTERDFSARYQISTRTLQRWRLTGDGAPYVRIGPRRIVYPLAAAEAWAAARTFPHRAAELAGATPLRESTTA